MQHHSARYKFAGHQTFAFRYGWLEKGVKAAAKDALVFSDKGRAMVQKCRNIGIPAYRHVGMSALPSAVFGFALLQYFQSLPDGRNTLSVQECMYGINSPGQIFKLDENSLMEYVEELEISTGGMIVLDETAGLKQVYRRVMVDPVSLLERHYHPEADNGR